MNKSLVPHKFVRFTANDGIYSDPWRLSDRHYKYYGKCPGCGIRTYAFDDGENDPRGILGEHAASEIAPTDYDMPDYLPTVNVCWMCENGSRSRYHRLLENVGMIWMKTIKIEDEPKLLDWLREQKRKRLEAEKG